MNEGEKFTISDEAEDSQHPFYLSDEELESLRLEVQTISAEKQKIYQELQQKACAEFVRQYGSFLDETQKIYLLAENVLIADPDKLPLLGKIWDRNIEQTSEKTLLNGKQYLLYEILEPAFRRKSGQDQTGVLQQSDSAAHFWAGRVAVVPLLEEFENHSLSPSLLISQKEYKNLQGGDFTKIFEGLETFVATSGWAGMALHEKIHGIQRHDLPLPILETMAYYYQDHTFCIAGWEPGAKIGFDAAIDYWDQLTAEIGPDLHKFVFGTLPAERSVEIRSLLVNKFSPEVMAHLFNRGELYSEVKWLSEEDPEMVQKEKAPDGDETP